MIGRKFRRLSTGVIYEVYSLSNRQVDEWCCFSDNGSGHSCGGQLPKGKYGLYLDNSDRDYYGLFNKSTYEEIIESFWRL